MNTLEAGMESSDIEFVTHCKHLQHGSNVGSWNIKRSGITILSFNRMDMEYLEAKKMNRSRLYLSPVSMNESRTPERNNNEARSSETGTHRAPTTCFSSK